MDRRNAFGDRFFFGLLLLSAISAVGLPGSAGADEGQAAQAPQEPIKLDQVTVTGSRIKQANLTAVSPVATIDSAEVERQGATRVEDLLNNMPQFSADQGSAIGSGADGTATANLRNLGSERTLVLIDGKRLLPGDPRNYGAADLNFIPAALIDRVEVSTGGASAVYGSDAIAGVVNFIMKQDFEGVRLDAEHSFYNHHNTDGASQGAISAAGFANPNSWVNDGQTADITGIMGVNSGDGKGNITVYANYRHIQQILQSKRDFGACALAEDTASTFACGGSGTSALGQFIPGSGSVVDANGNGLTLDTANPGTFRNFDPATDAYNYAPLNPFQRPDEHYGLGAFAHYDFTPAVKVYAQLMFQDDRSHTLGAPSGIFGQIVNISCDNPFLSTAQAAALCDPSIDQDGDPTNGTTTAASQGNKASVSVSRRNVEGGPRDDDQRHTAYRMIAGLKGDINKTWSYDVSAQFATTTFAEVLTNDVSLVRSGRALNVVKDPITSAPVCASVLDGTDPACVPYDIFNVGGVTTAAQNYIAGTGLSSGHTREQVVTGSGSGNLGDYGIKMPLATGGLSVAFGAEYRAEDLLFNTDEEQSSGDLAGQGGALAGTAGSFQVKELFAEARLPILEDQPFAKDLTVEVGLRRSFYSSSAGITNTFKYGGEWAPIADFRFRGSFNRAVRAPSINEIASPLSIVLDGTTDPCAGPIVTFGASAADDTVDGGATRAQCANDPLIAAQPGRFGTIPENPASQYNGQEGSSPGLKAETANTYSVGFVFEPSALKGFNLTVDYYDISVDGLIGGYGADTILNTCYNSGNLCNLIHRSPGAGDLFLGTAGYVIDVTQNTGSEKVRGLDVAANYRMKLSNFGLSNAGTLLFELVGTRAIEESHQPVPGGDTYSCQGKYGPQCLAPVPAWRHKLRATWTTPWSTAWFAGLEVSGQWRHIDGVTIDSVGAPSSNDLESKLGARDYFDLSGSVHVASFLTVRLGINNLFDRDPPLVGTNVLSPIQGNGNTYPQTYDTLGRNVFIGLTADF